MFSHDCKHLKTADWLARSLARERETRGWWSHDGWTLARASMSIGVLNHLETLHEARCKQSRPRCPFAGGNGPQAQPWRFFTCMP